TPRGLFRGKEAKLLEAWEIEKNATLDAGLTLLNPEVLKKVDIPKLWGFILFHLNMPPVQTTALEKKNKDDIIRLIDISKQPLVDFLMTPSSSRVDLEEDPDMMDRVLLARSLSIKVVERLIVGRKPRTSIAEYPDWLTDKGFFSLLKDFLKMAETADGPCILARGTLFYRFPRKVSPLKSNLGVKEKLTGGGEEKKTLLVQADIRGVLGACGGEEIYHPSGITGFQSRVEKRESEEEFFSGIESLQSSDEEEVGDRHKEHSVNTTLWEEERIGQKDIKAPFCQESSLSLAPFTTEDVDQGQKGAGDMKQGHGERDPLSHDQDDSADVTNKTELGKTSVGGRKHVENNLPRRRIDYDFERLLDDKLLETYFEEFGGGQDDSYDPRQRYVTRFRYRATGESGRSSAKANGGSDDRGTVGNQKEEVRGGDGKTTDWIQVNKKKTRSPRGMIDDTHEKREVKMEMEREGKESEAEQTRKAVTTDKSFFLHDGSTAGSAEDFLLEVKMWTKMILSLSAEELEHLIKNLRTEYLELQMMERDLETDFDALCQEKSVSLSTQEGQNIRKNYEKEQRRLEYKLKTICTRLAHCTHEADKRREKMDRESEEQDRGREKDDDDGETERDEKPESKGKKDAKRGGEKGGKRGKEAERCLKEIYERKE
ncbi:UNVERIFIED_CONTAM: hypothetical protein K2H54_065886, partial [Gekko kuhli]